MSAEPPPPAPTGRTRAAGGSRQWLAVVPWALAALGLGWGLVSTLRPRPAAQPADSPLALELAMGTEDLYNELGPSFALSRDGRTLAYVEIGGAKRHLFVRSLDQLVPNALSADDATSGTGPITRSCRRDGDWIGYATPGELRKVQVSGGAPLTICKVARSRGATWLADDTIVFSPDPASGLFRVPAAGGEPQPLTKLDEQGQGDHAPLAAGAARWQARPVHLQHHAAQLRQRHPGGGVGRRPGSARWCTGAAPSAATCRPVTWCS